MSTLTGNLPVNNGSGLFPAAKKAKHEMTIRCDTCILSQTYSLVSLLIGRRGIFRVRVAS